MNNDGIREYYAEWKIKNPESYKRQIRQENTEALGILVMALLWVTLLFVVLLGVVICWIVRFFTPATKAVLHALKTIDEWFIYDFLTGGR